MTSRLYFFVGTIAELIKLTPILLNIRDRGIPFTIIGSGQNDLTQDSLWEFCKGQPNLFLSNRPRAQSAFGLLSWFVSTGLRGFFRLREEFGGNQPWVVVHGDTISTLMGAVLGRVLGAKVAHVEAGLRSHNYLRPFPEEICRVAVSKLANVAFCPNQGAAENIAKLPCVKVNTEGNTLMDSLQIYKTDPADEKRIPHESYFVCVVHRQENLIDTPFLREILNEIAIRAKTLHCYFILHEPTRAKLQKMGNLESLKKNPNITLLPRQDFCAFLKLLRGSYFLVTDGGSNQQEAFYLGKPCLVLRKETEQPESIGSNAILSEKNMHKIRSFLDEPEKYQRNPMFTSTSPSEIISNWLVGTLNQPVTS